ncbi:MAG: hypothetical protein JNL35_03465 [Sphingopyxis sp.]|nr:hypothetical protein [Sphingopyxis sp.]
MRGAWRRFSTFAGTGALLLASSGFALAWQGSTAAKPPLPAFPARPQLDTASYPDCREAYQKIAAPFDKATAINRCTVAIDTYYAQKMLPYREAMIAYQNRLSALYSEKVGGQMRYSAETQADFYQRIMAEHAASDPEGENLAAYRGIEARYQTDRAYLADRFCFNTGCNGYPVPASAVPAPVTEQAVVGDSSGKGKKDDKRKQADADGGKKTCKKARKRGGAIGGLIGSVAGSAAGLDGVGTAISGLFGAVLVGEIACQLDEKEQKVAAEATIAVTQKEAVGATAEWKSPTREGVSGSSTITALNTEPNGSKCLAITDIAIVEGEETRVSKRMCRKKAGEPYSIMA